MLLRSITNILRAIRRIVHLLARRGAGNRDPGGIIIQPYRGYGSREELFLIGRVVRQPPASVPPRTGAIGRDLLAIGRRLVQRGVADAVLVARFGGTEHHVTTDRAGYFRVHLRPAQFPPTDGVWHQMELALIRPADAAASVTGEFYVPPRTTRFVVISDIDDTVVATGVANKAAMVWRLFAHGARSHAAFPGVVALYQALHAGVSGADRNPLLYVSRSPWIIYELLDEFFNRHNIPVGPVLFLRDWGVTPQHPLPRRAKSHKLALIRDMVALYRDLPFVLIGDSGQHDPEIYAQVVREHPGRVLAIYIRNVSRDPQRIRAIEGLAQDVIAAGSSLVLAADSFAMAQHAAAHDLIAPAALADVLAERAEHTGDADLPVTHAVKQGTAQQLHAAVEQGAVHAALTATTDDADDAPPNVVVEAETHRAPRAAPD
jgi:phosphatidate phosphatase APP1